MAIPAPSARRASSGAFIRSSSQPSRVFSVTGTSTAPTTASISDSAWSRSRISAEPERPPTTFLAGQPMLMSMIRAPCPATMRAASAIQQGSRPASCTAVAASPRPSSARARTEGFSSTISRLATISETTRPAPKDATSRRNGRSVIPAMGARRTGGARPVSASETANCSNLVHVAPSIERADSEFKEKPFVTATAPGRSRAFDHIAHLLGSCSAALCRVRFGPKPRPMSSAPETDTPPTAAAIIVAAGRGVRAGGGLPKQYRDLAGRSVLARTVAAFDAHPAVGEIVVVRNPDDAALYAAAGIAAETPLSDVAGGATRDASVRAGLAAVPGDLPFVLIHDAARPLVSRSVIDGVLAALATHEAAAPALRVTDALWRGDGTVTGTESREGLWRAQTPQGFHLGAIRAAHEAHAARGGPAADDVEVARAAGLAVAITPGDAANMKITGPEDFARAERFLQEGRHAMDIRTGNGFDVHRFGPGDHVMALRREGTA
jgi:2-C-methyl-D-erythritol 4-phosphate cytidylyltransferase